MPQFNFADALPQVLWLALIAAQTLQHELHHECGFDQEGIELAVMQLLELSSKTA